LRPIFITPLARAVLIGTTDMPFEGPPQRAQTTQREIEYLLDSVNTVLPEARLQPSDVDFHCSAVRPLPFTRANSTAAITRRHSFVRHDAAAVPMFSIVGGKLTTMRSLAEQATATTFQYTGGTVRANSRERIFPGGEDYPPDAAGVEKAQREISQRTGFSGSRVAAVWNLCGTRSASILAASNDLTLLPNTDLPSAFVRWSIENEHVHTLPDLVERRLMLLYDQRLTRACLRRLAALLAEAGRLEKSQIDAATEQEIERLSTRYGKHVS
jgi:glycerol-3-phosphate dehydrogenase